MKIEDVKVKVVVDDAQARVVIDELMRGAAAMEQLLVGLSKALCSDAGQAVVIDALARRIEELKVQMDHERDRSELVLNARLVAHRALALQFEEGDLAEVLCEQLDPVIKAGSVVKVETTPVQRGVGGKPLWGEGDWAPTTVMCSHPERVGNLEIALIDLHLVTKGGAR